MEWKFTDDRPIWQQLSQQIARQILIGVYPPGSKLPPVRELAAQAGVNPNTMQRALAQLEQAGRAVTNRPGGGLFPRDRGAIEAARGAQAQGIIRRYLESMNELGYSPEEAVELLKEEK